MFNYGNVAYVKLCGILYLSGNRVISQLECSNWEIDCHSYLIQRAHVSEYQNRNLELVTKDCEWMKA